ncbi:MAG: SRPBCC family protein [Candidatus Omnitrophica bacterium]|nr:SRPBCC family protein [Candidatus Omnitrophota bacterium]
MYTINVKSHINTSPTKLLKIWRKPQILLKYATNIKKLEILKREKNRVLTAWEVEIDKILLKWSQWDALDAKKMRIDFKLYEGIFNQYQGSWIISQTNQGCFMLELCVDVDWKIPCFEPAVLRKLRWATDIIFRDFIESIKTLCCA